MTSHTKPIEMIASRGLSEAWRSIATRIPVLTRLEPQSLSGDPRHGAVAAIGDPLWLLGRQWQLGELLGEDVGSPVSVRVQRRALPITAWAPAGRTDGTDRVVDEPAWRPWPGNALLDELVEHVPRSDDRRGLRWRAETGAQLQEMLREAGHDEVADALHTAHPLTLPADPADPDHRLDPVALQLFRALDGVVCDGSAAREALEGGDPAWLAGANDLPGARAVVADWQQWAGAPPGAGGAWTTSRLEHRFLLRFGHGADALVVQATAFGQGSARWHHFEWLDGTRIDLTGDGDLPAIDSVTDVMLATPLRYPGMPADRYWQLEEGSVDVSRIEAQPHDLARLCLAEFALVSGDDWLLVPVDGRRGAANQVERVWVTTTFGETLEIAEAGADRRTRGFRMFEVTSASGNSLPGIVFPPAAATPLLGEPLEEIVFLRDETANMGWAVERIVPGRSGDPRPRSAEPPPPRPVPSPTQDPNEVSYALQTPVPHHWIPLVPVRLGPGVIGLRKGAMLAGGEPVLPLGVLLEPTPLTFPLEVIPREGVSVRAVPALARRADGTYARWIGHRVRTGRGEGSSGFASDEARSVNPSGG